MIFDPVPPLPPISSHAHIESLDSNAGGQGRFQSWQTAKFSLSALALVLFIMIITADRGDHKVEKPILAFS
jgi:hypothetical protein